MKLNTVFAWELNKFGIETSKIDSTPFRLICLAAMEDYQWFPGNQVGSGVSPSKGRKDAVVTAAKYTALIILGPTQFAQAGGDISTIEYDLGRAVCGLHNRQLVGLERLYADAAVILAQSGLAHPEFMGIIGARLHALG